MIPDEEDGKYRRARGKEERVTKKFQRGQKLRIDEFNIHQKQNRKTLQ